jgi:hypothetical protein
MLTQPQAAPHAQSRFRWISLLAYSLAVPAYLYRASLASDAYSEACTKEIARTATHPLEAIGLALIMVGVITLPTLLARSDALVTVNLCLSLFVAGFAVSLLFTARTPPYECFTSGGSYEDHVSGLLEFTLCSAFVVVVSYFFVLLEWSIWELRNSGRLLKHR